MVYGWHIAASKRESIIGVQLSRYPQIYILNQSPISCEINLCVTFETSPCSGSIKPVK